MTRLIPVDDAPEPEISRPDPGRLVSGDPVLTTWNVEERDGLYAGRWHATVGAWQVVYDEWEYFRIIEGHSILTEEGGEPRHLRPGDGWVIRPGFRGVWEVVEPTLKDYVIRL